LDKLLETRHHHKDIIVILDNIRSAYNVGAILRTADGAGVKKVYICGISPDSNHPKVVKTALGAEEYVETRHFDTTLEAIDTARAEGYMITSVEQSEQSISIENIRNVAKVCLIFGNEITGINIEILKNSDRILEIPMFGKKNSLNVATTAGIVLYYLVLD